MSCKTIVPQPGEAHLAGIACAVLALFAGGMVAGSILSANRGNVSTLVRMARSDALLTRAQEIEEDFHTASLPAHYDGVYYYAIALDPFATGEEHGLIDLAAHRYGHPAYGWLARVASLGNDKWIPEALLGLSLLGMAVGAYVVSRLASALQLGSPWAGLLVALNPGLLFAVAADTSEALSTAFLALALWFWLRNRRILATPFLVALCFFKFQLVLVPVGLGLWELIRSLRTRPWVIPWKTLTLLSIGPVLFALWQIYVFDRLGEWPTSLGPELLSIPPMGFLSTIGLLGHIDQVFSGDAQLIAAQLPILVGIFILFVVAFVRALRFRNAIDCIFMFQALMFLSLNEWNLYFPKELIRVAAIPMILMVIVLSREDTVQKLAHLPMAEARP